MKSWEGQIDTKAVGFIEDTEDIENHEICPFMSCQGVLVRCRKDCGIYWKQMRKCSIKGLTEYFGYRGDVS